MDEGRWKRLKSRLEARAKAIARDLGALWYAYRDPRAGWPSRLAIAFAVAYALSPIDLIPDFIPLIGYLDDLLLLPALIALSVKLLPPQVLADARERARREPPFLRKRRLFGVFVVLLWLSAAGLAAWAVLG